MEICTPILILIYVLDKHISASVPDSNIFAAYKNAYYELFSRMCWRQNWPISS